MSESSELQFVSGCTAARAHYPFTVCIIQAQRSKRIQSDRKQLRAEQIARREAEKQYHAAIHKLRAQQLSVEETEKLLTRSCRD